MSNINCCSTIYSHYQNGVSFDLNGLSDTESDDIQLSLDIQDFGSDSETGSDSDETCVDEEVLCPAGGIGTCEQQICHRWPIVSTLLSYGCVLHITC